MFIGKGDGQFFFPDLFQLFVKISFVPDLRPCFLIIPRIDVSFRSAVSFSMGSLTASNKFWLYEWLSVRLYAAGPNRYPFLRPTCSRKFSWTSVLTMLAQVPWFNPAKAAISVSV